MRPVKTPAASTPPSETPEVTPLARSCDKATGVVAAGYDAGQSADSDTRDESAGLREIAGIPSLANRESATRNQAPGGVVIGQSPEPFRHQRNRRRASAARGARRRSYHRANRSLYLRQRRRGGCRSETFATGPARESGDTGAGRGNAEAGRKRSAREALQSCADASE